MPSWTFITSHGAVLALIGRRNHITTREIAAHVGLTERSVMRIIKDLETAGYIEKEKVGRANHYKIRRDLPLRRQGAREVVIGELLKILED